MCIIATGSTWITCDIIEILGTICSGLLQRASLKPALTDVAEREIIRFLSLAVFLSPGKSALSLTRTHFIKTLLLLCRLVKSLVPAGTAGGGLICVELVIRWCTVGGRVASLSLQLFCLLQQFSVILCMGTWRSARRRWAVMSSVSGTGRGSDTCMQAWMIHWYCTWWHKEPCKVLGQIQPCFPLKKIQPCTWFKISSQRL